MGGHPHPTSNAPSPSPRRSPLQTVYLDPSFVFRRFRGLLEVRVESATLYGPAVSAPLTQLRARLSLAGDSGVASTAEAPARGGRPDWKGERLALWRPRGEPGRLLRVSIRAGGGVASLMGRTAAGDGFLDLDALEASGALGRAGDVGLGRLRTPPALLDALDRLPGGSAVLALLAPFSSSVKVPVRGPDGPAGDVSVRLRELPFDAAETGAWDPPSEVRAALSLLGRATSTDSSALSEAEAAWGALAARVREGFRVPPRLAPVAFVENMGTDTQCYVLADRGRREIVVAFRGTEQAR